MEDHPVAKFHYCFNTSTIRGQKLSLVEEIDIAAKAGYQAIEPWINEIQGIRRARRLAADLEEADQRLRTDGRKRDRLCRMDRGR